MVRTRPLRVEALEEDLFQEFQLQTLQSLKKLHALQTQQGHSSWQSGQSSLSSHTIFTAIPSPLSSTMTSLSPLSSATRSPPPVISAMTSPSPSSSCYPRTAFHHSQGQTPRSHWYGQSQHSPMPPELYQPHMRSQGSEDYSNLGQNIQDPRYYDIQ